jgi:uncharacterized protein with NRDE domain
MCTLAFYFHVFPRYRIVVAANRDESLTRPSSLPIQLHSSPWIYGGRDLLAGGTWLGINESGLVAAVLNRQTPEPIDPQRRSRGLLCLEALTYPSATAALQFVTAEPARRYNACNVLLADHTTAYVAHTRDGAFQVSPLPPGVYLITNSDANDPRCPRIARSSCRFQQISHKLSGSADPLPAVFTELQLLLSDHGETGTHPRDGLCLHLDGYGTSSSTLLAYSTTQHRFTYHFAPGPPCRSVYQEVPVPSGALASHPPSMT